MNEKDIDKQLKCNGVDKTFIYHLRDIPLLDKRSELYTVSMTFATPKKYTQEAITEMVFESEDNGCSITDFVEKIGSEHGMGVAICNAKDSFSKLRGRFIAKGRLLKQYRK